MKPVRAALYCRCSTSQHQTPDMQLRELREYCSRRGWLVAGEWTDLGVSGSRESRPQLNKLLAECRRRKLDAVVVYRYDRFARSLRHLVNALEEFRSLGVEFVSLHEGVDTSTPNGRLVFGIFASIAEFERDLIRERVKSGMAAARARGAKIGRPKCKIDIAEVQALRSSGATWPTVARELNIGMSTLFRIVAKSTHNNHAA